MITRDWRNITDDLTIKWDGSKRLLISDMQVRKAAESHIEVSASEIRPLIDALHEIEASAQGSNQEVSEILIDPQPDHILVAWVIGGIVNTLTRFASFDASHYYIATLLKSPYNAQKVRCDAGFRTGETRMQIERYRWVEDNTVDLRGARVGGEC